jgi:hypothetical protein
VDQIAAAIQGELPAWASVFATLLLGVAAGIARRISRRSARPQGERLGLLEQEFALERTRRRQLEDVLWEEGINLPPWPPDGLRRPSRPRSYEPYSGRGPWPQDGVPLPPDDEDDQADELEELGPETIARRVPVPPLPADVGARHRREAQR